MKKIAATLILIAMFALKAYATEVSLQSEQLQTVADIFLMEDKAMLHSCGFIAVHEFKNKVTSQGIRNKISEIAREQNTVTKTVTYNSVDKNTLDAVSSISMDPGWPPSLSEGVTLGLISVIKENLYIWRDYQNLPLEEMVFEGSFNSEESSSDFFAIYDQDSKQLLIVNINASEECE